MADLSLGPVEPLGTHELVPMAFALLRGEDWRELETRYPKRLLQYFMQLSAEVNVWDLESS